MASPSRSNTATDATPPRHWLQVTLTTAQPAIVEAALLEAGALAVTLRDAADQPLLEPLPGETPLWDEVRVTGLFDGDRPTEAVQACLAPLLDRVTLDSIESELIEDRLWVREWMTHFQPIQCGERLWVCPSHHVIEQPDAIVVRLDPGLAFGTGTHPTTALCLRWLDDVQTRPNLRGSTLIDFGCGSGILAVAAALLGAQKVWAVDIDPQALEATRSNAKINQVDARIETCLPEDLPTGVQADLILANILAGPLVRLAPELSSHLRNNGQLVLAGLLDSQATEVTAAYAQHLALQTIFRHDTWCLLAGKKAS